MKINTPSDFGRAIKSGPYAWPGGYPIFFVTSDGAALSFDSAKENAKQICQAIRDRDRGGWRVIGADINWEDANLFCDHSGEPIESAYGE
jgi:hypothetical protein